MGRTSTLHQLPISMRPWRPTSSCFCKDTRDLISCRAACRRSTRRVASNTAAQPVSTVSSSRLAGPPIVPLIAVIPALAVYGLFILWPAAWVVILSFQQWTGYGPATFDGLLNYGQLFADPLFQTSLRHSLLWELGAVLAVVPGLGIALVLHHSRRPALWLAVLFFPALLPATVVAGLWWLRYSPLSA